MLLQPPRCRELFCFPMASSQQPRKKRLLLRGVSSEEALTKGRPQPRPFRGPQIKSWWQEKEKEESVAEMTTTIFEES